MNIYDMHQRLLHLSFVTVSCLIMHFAQVVLYHVCRYWMRCLMFVFHFLCNKVEIVLEFNYICTCIYR